MVNNVLNCIDEHFAKKINNRNYFYGRTYSIYIIAVNTIFKMDEETPSGNDNIVTEFATYEDFLDSQITQLDLYYLEVSM